MLPVTQPNIVRRMYDRTEFAGVPADLAAYIRTEYEGNHGAVLAEITRAARATPAIRRVPWTSRVTASIGRLSEALANAFSRASGS